MKKFSTVKFVLAYFLNAILILLYFCSFLVGIKSTDNGDPPLSLTKYFTIRIDDVNERPTNIVVCQMHFLLSKYMLFLEKKH